MKPLVYLYEDQVNLLFHNFKGPEQVIDANAYAMDNDTVFHAFIGSPKTHPAGVETLCKFILYSNSEFLIQSGSRAKLLVSNNAEHRPVLMVFLAIAHQKLDHTCFFGKGA